MLALLFPSNLAAKAALFALVVALLPLLPSSGQQQAPRIWELPHLLLLGIVISYGVFGQRNADAEAAAKPVDDLLQEASTGVEAYVSQMMQGSLPLAFDQDNDDDDGRDGGASSSKKDGGVQAWSSQYLPDDPLVVVAGATGTANSGNGDAGEKPLLLPVRKLKPADEEEEDVEVEEELFPVPNMAYAGSHAIPSPSSVLDADLTLSPPLLPPPPPPPPPFLGRERRLRKAKARSFNGFGATGNRSRTRQFRSRSAVQATSRAFAGYDPVVPLDDDDEADDKMLGEVVAASDDSSFGGSDGVATDDEAEDAIKEEENSCEEEDERGEDGGGNSCDEGLFELATGSGPEEEAVEDEVDRKADEFIAKFREQIRMQRVAPPAARR